jgi:hypothetical protein
MDKKTIQVSCENIECESDGADGINMTLKNIMVDDALSNFSTSELLKHICDYKKAYGDIVDFVHEIEKGKKEDAE